MLLTTLYHFIGYLCCGLLLAITGSAAPLDEFSLIKRRITKEPGVINWLAARPQLAFDVDFEEMTKTFEFIKFSAIQLSDLKPWQKKEGYWRPKSRNTDLYPSKYFFDACLATPVGEVFNNAILGKILKDSQVTLINLWGTFSSKDGQFQPWKFEQDGILAVSCQIMSIPVNAIPANSRKYIDFRKFVMEAESSTQMIANMRKEGWSIEQVAKPSHGRLELETQIKANKKAAA